MVEFAVFCLSMGLYGSARDAVIFGVFTLLIYVLHLNFKHIPLYRDVKKCSF